MGCGCGSLSNEIQRVGFVNEKQNQHRIDLKRLYELRKEQNTVTVNTTTANGDRTRIFSNQQIR
jgi:hypothetical protein